MRNGLAGFFVLGAMIPVAGGGIVLFANAVFGQGMQWSDSLATVLATGLIYLLLRLVGKWLSSLHTYEQRPHQLFTPLYEQRRHEWAWHAA